MSKKKSRFNVVDAVIILFVAAAVAVFGYVFLNEKTVGTAGAEKVTIQYVLKVGEIKDMFTGNIVKGDQVYDADSDKSLGTVVAVSSAPSKRVGTNSATGAQVASEIEGRSDLYVTIEAEAKVIDEKYLVDGFHVVVGSVVNFVTPNLYAPSNIVSVEIVD